MTRAERERPYRPSNGTEGESFIADWCGNCKRDRAFQEGGNGDGCKIVAATFCFDVDDPEYPKEWIYSETGQPKCTAFEHIDAPESARCEHTKDLF